MNVKLKQKSKGISDSAEGYRWLPLPWRDTPLFSPASWAGLWLVEFILRIHTKGLEIVPSDDKDWHVASPLAFLRGQHCLWRPDSSPTRPSPLTCLSVESPMEDIPEKVTDGLSTIYHIILQKRSAGDSRCTRPCPRFSRRQGHSLLPGASTVTTR